MIAISGTPGCGKTTFAKRLAKAISAPHIELTTFIQKHMAQTYNKVDQVYDIDTNQLQQLISKHCPSNAILDGHLSHFLKVTKCIICTCELKELKKRLKKRKYTKEKVRENLDAEIFDTCYTESIERDIPTMKIDCTTKPDLANAIDFIQATKSQSTQ